MSRAAVANRSEASCLLWNLLRHGEGAFDWETTFFFAITFGVALPWIERMRSREQKAEAGEP